MFGGVESAYGPSALHDAVHVGAHVDVHGGGRKLHCSHSHRLPPSQQVAPAGIVYQCILNIPPYRHASACYQNSS